LFWHWKHASEFLNSLLWAWNNNIFLLMMNMMSLRMRMFSSSCFHVMYQHTENWHMLLAVFKIFVMIKNLNILSWFLTSMMKMTSSSSNSQIYMRNRINELKNIWKINCFWKVLKLSFLWENIINFFFIFFKVKLWVSLFFMIKIKQFIKTEKNKTKTIRSDKIDRRERKNR